MGASNDFILRNRLKQMELLCMHWINDPVQEKAQRLLKVPLFYFHSIGVSFVHLWTGIAVPTSVCSDRRTCLHTHTHTQNECLFNGLGASGVMISPESRPPRAKGTPTAALPQVGQHGTTELGRNSCPPTPWEVKSAHWMDGSGVLDSQQDLSIHLPWHLIQILHLLLPYHLPLASHQTGPLSCALTSLYIHQQHYIHMIHWALKASKTAYKNHFIALWNVKFLHFFDSVLTRTTSLIICSNV